MFGKCGVDARRHSETTITVTVTTIDDAARKLSDNTAGTPTHDATDNNHRDVAPKLDVDRVAAAKARDVEAQAHNDAARAATVTAIDDDPNLGARLEATPTAAKDVETEGEAERVNDGSARMATRLSC